MNCPNCGSPVGEKAGFCANCGARIPLSEPLPKAPASTAPTQYARVTAPPAQYAPVPTAPTQYAPVPNTRAQYAPVAAPPAQYAPVPTAPTQYAPVPNTRAQYAPVTAPSAQYAPVTAAPAQYAPVPNTPAQYAPVPTAPTQYAPASVPVIPAAPAAPKPVSPLSRPYRLTTLATAVTYGIQTQVATLGVCIAALILLFPAIFRSVSTGSAGALDLESLLKDSKILVLLVVYAVVYVGGLLLGILVAGAFRKRLPARAPEVRRMSVADFLLCVMVAYALWMLGVLAGNFPSFVVPLESLETQFGWYSAPLWVLAIVAAPILEELVFRKFVLDRVGHLGEGIAVLSSALIFGLAHQNAGQFFLAFFLGLLFAKIYLRTGRILYTMLLHFLINLTATADEIGCLIWGDRFDTVFLLAAGGLALAGLVLWLVFRKRHFLLRPCAPIPARDRNAALRCWPMTLVKIVCLVSVAGYGVFYAVSGVFLYGSYNLKPLGLLYLIPAAGAVITVLILTRRQREPRNDDRAPVVMPGVASPCGQQSEFR